MRVRRKFTTDAERLEANREKVRAWQSRNPAYRRAARKRHAAAHPEVGKAARKRYAQRNPEKLKCLRAAWLAANPEKAQAMRARAVIKGRVRSRAYYRENKAAAFEKSARRRFSKKRATPAWANIPAMREVYARAKREGKVVDHIVPLVSKLVCGLHCDVNLQLLTALENTKKHNRHWPDMP